METKINIAEILKDTPQGTKLYSILSDGECFLNEASEDSIYIDIDNRKRFWCLSAYGSTHSFPNGCVLLFPSKEMRDWSKFAWKKGDVLVCKDYNSHIIFEKFNDDTYTTFTGKLYYQATRAGYSYTHTRNLAMTQDFDIEECDAVQTYIKTIEEKLGGKLNRETLEIEKTQPEFKDGDILSCDEDTYTRHTTLIFHKNGCVVESLVSLIRHHDLVESSEPINEVLLSRLYYAREDEKEELFDALAKEGKRWDSEKKQIVDLKPKCEFKPMDLCLMKYIGQYNNRGWELCQYAYTEHRVSSSGEQRDFYHSVGGEIYAECIPYNEDTKHLLGTRDKWKGGEG